MNVPTCPECAYKFTLIRSLRHWNPYNTKCPQCGARLRLKQANLALVLAFFCGLALAGGAIIGAKNGIWGLAGGHLFIVLTGLFAGMPVAMLAWYKCQYVLRRAY